MTSPPCRTIQSARLPLGGIFGWEGQECAKLWEEVSAAPGLGKMEHFGQRFLGEQGGVGGRCQAQGKMAHSPEPNGAFFGPRFWA